MPKQKPAASTTAAKVKLRTNWAVRLTTCLCCSLVFVVYRFINKRRDSYGCIAGRGPTRCSSSNRLNAATYFKPADYTPDRLSTSSLPIFNYHICFHCLAENSARRTNCPHPQSRYRSVARGDEAMLKRKLLKNNSLAGFGVISVPQRQGFEEWPGAPGLVAGYRGAGDC